MKRMIQMVVPIAVAVAVAACGVDDEVETSTTPQAVTSSNGIWENGFTTNGIWENGIWENGIWENGIWENGIWENGIWENGIWENGIWENGIWENGIWENGIWQGNLVARAVLRDNPYARQLLQYLYSCAMPAGASQLLDAGDGVTVALEGGIGLWPTWAYSTSDCSTDTSTVPTCRDKVTAWRGLMPGVPLDECDETCQRWLSACLLARTNAYGERVAISMRAPDDAPVAIQNVLATTAEEEAEFGVREGAYYGNLFQTYRDASGRIVNNPVFFACAGPGSNIPYITRRFCSSQGADGVITNTGVCEPTPGHVSACNGTVAEGAAVQDCFAPSSGLVPDTRYHEVITVYVRDLIAVCGNSVCEEGEEAGETAECPTDCHPGSWAKSYDHVSLPSVVAPQHQKLPVISRVAVSPVDDSVVITGAVQAAVVVDLGGGPLAGSGSSDPLQWDLVLVKYDRNGNYVWGRRIPQLVRLQPGSIAIDGAGNIAVAAERESASSDQLWIGKLDPAGNMLSGWPRTYGGSADIIVGAVSIKAGGLAFDTAGNLVLAGAYKGTATFGSYTFTSEGFTGTLSTSVPDGFVLALSPAGAMRWARSVGGARVGDLAVDGHGNAVAGVIGVHDATHPREPHRLVKLRVGDGAELWSRLLPTEIDEGLGVAADPLTDDVYVTGRIMADFDFGGGTVPGSGDLYVAKYTAANSYVWARLSNSIIDPGPAWARVRGWNVELGPSGDVIVNGDFETHNGGLVDFGSGRLESHAIFDLFVASYRKSDGAARWSKHIPAVLFDMGHAMQIDSRGHIVLTGYFDGSMIIDDRLLVNGIPELTQHPNVFLASIPPPPPPGVDLTPPTLDRFPEPLFVQATSSLGARVWFMPPIASDAGNHGVHVHCAPAPSSMFPRGTTTVTCTATDVHGNAASGTFPVTVGDDLGPVISGVAPVDAVATVPGGALVTYPAPTATDQIDGARGVSCAPASGTVFPVGTTTVRCGSTDASGNTTTRSFPVTVVDKTPPDITVPKNFTVPATSSGGAVVSYSVKGYDVVDGTVPVTCTPKSQSWFPLGLTTVVCKAVDKSGNQSESKFTVKVELQWSGILQPVNADGSSIYRVGSIIPFRFQLTGASSEIKDLQATWTLTKLSKYVTGSVYEKETASFADSGNVFRYEVVWKSSTYFWYPVEQYAFNLSTKYLTYGDWLLRINMGDGTTRSVRFSVK